MAPETPPDPAGIRPAEARSLFRQGLVVPTAGWSAGWTQANLIAVPRDIAEDVQVFAERNEEALNSDTLKNIFAEYAIARDLASGGNLSDWNMATNRIIEGTAAAQVMEVVGAMSNRPRQPPTSPSASAVIQKASTRISGVEISETQYMPS